MSRSTPFFNTKRAAPKRDSYIDEQEFKNLHWTRQLELRPLASQKRRIYEQGDFDTRLEMDWDDNDNKEITP